MSAGPGPHLPEFVTRTARAVELIQDATTGTWTPEQRTKGQQIATANDQRSHQSADSIDGYRP